MTLLSLGWDSTFDVAFRSLLIPDLIPARVARVDRGLCRVFTERGEFSAECTGRLLHHSENTAALPAVGDWAAVRIRGNDLQADIHAVLPRRTCFSRTAAGAAETEQAVAANVDTVFLVSALDANYNLRRIERYLAVAWSSGAQPVVLLNKADLHEHPERARCEVATIAPGAEVVVLSAARGEGLGALAPWLQPGRTVAFLGSSGVGKSTLINLLLGEDTLATAETSRAHGKGRHTTTWRELLVAPGGTLLIDTPGMRELQLWDVGDEALDASFGEVAALAPRCRFADCTHRAEPGCAVQEALEDGSLSLERWQSWQKLQREQEYAARRADPVRERATKAAWKKIHHGARQQMKLKYGE